METDTAIMNMNQFEFAVFCIENIAIRLGVNAGRVYPPSKEIRQGHLPVCRKSQYFIG